MATMDKAAIGWSIAIVAIGVAIAFAGQSGQNLGIDIQKSNMAIPEEPVEEIKEAVDPFAEIAEKVKQNPSQAMEEATEPAKEIGQELKEEIQETAPGPKTHKVAIPAGTSVPGCEETNECYLPATVRVFAGDTVEWTNDDTAAHTVTAGSPSSGPTGEFDSTLMAGGQTFSVAFEGSGNFDYFCMVHPWMTGTVQVR